MYLKLQVAQIALAFLVFFFCYYLLKKRQRSLAHSPLLCVIVGYVVACSLSNVFRSLTNDFTAVEIISVSDYTKGTAWWCISIVVFLVSYCIFYSNQRRLYWPKKAYELNFQNKILKKCNPWYFTALVFLWIAYLLNPYRGVNFGVLNAVDSSDLVRGGLLVSGFIVLLISGLSIPLAGCRCFVGIPLLLGSIVLLVLTGSKAIASVYIGVVALQLMRLSLGSWRIFKCILYKRRLVKALIALGLVISACAWLLTYSVGQRYEEAGIKINEAVATTLSRFSHQDIASIIYVQSEWRRGFRSEYLVDTILSFVPGFVWQEKPNNPAYKINELMERGFTAASPSFFGALLIVFDGATYWLALILCGIILALVDSWIGNIKRFDISGHNFWYVFYTASMLIEGNFVIWLVQIFILIIWRSFIAEAFFQTDRSYFVSFGNIKWG